MKRARLVAMILTLGCATVGCSNPAGTSARGDRNMKSLSIKWQRLVDETGKTCDRCGSTGAEVRKAVGGLKEALAPLGIRVVLEEETLDPAAFAQDPLQSNRIWIGDRALEEWLGAGVGSSPCCGPCGDAECRTVTVEGCTYEEIPAELIVKAGLLAAAASSPQPCCGAVRLEKAPRASCCQEADDAEGCCE